MEKRKAINNDTSVDRPKAAILLMDCKADFASTESLHSDSKLFIFRYQAQQVHKFK